MTDVLIAGGGPAGRALANACARAGLTTALIDPQPDRPWTATYGAWADELPAGTPVRSQCTTVRAFARSEHRIDRTYVVLDNTALHTLDPQVTVHRGRLAGRADGPRGSTADLADGRRLATALLVDARGAQSGTAAQTAVGTVITSSRTDATLMDWRDGDTFLYEVPLGDGKLLVEETSLARRPGMPLAELRRRLHARVQPEETTEERVHFPLDAPRAKTLAFGSRAGFVHPATGYSVATSLTLAPSVASAVASTLRAGPRAARMAAHHVIWPPSAKLVHQLRRRGLEVLLELDADETRDFFELFFRLPAELQRAYLSGRDDVKGTAAAMAELFRAAPWRLRAKLVR
ncbi:lycopene cyclase [Lentzea tibetensis]|uniref:Lycopene cyclase n=1 Tax=Lentzea tibetensis TaxID=2591470 RepID=A0A563EWC1_9PSEU|nr:lycopene cyclase family protein [Lentzea tibetensis]TWP51969.1 lycopene cyclase [Lentzea tibetensis]